MTRRIAVLVLAAIAMLARPAWADDYPSRPIRLIVGFAAGSSGDVMARILAHRLGDALKQSVVVEDKPGASSMVATDYVARSTKDGYVLMFATIATVINMTMMPAKAPNVEKDMTPITLVGSIPNILVVNPKSGIDGVKGLIARAKAKPDELLYGAAGIGSGPHLATELFKQMAGVKMTGVLYPGSSQTAVDLISGRIQVMFAPAPTVLGLIKDGRVKALATTGAERSPALPDLPTIAEAALPGYSADLWFGILGPGGLPKPVTDKLAAAINTALKDPAVQKQLQTQGLTPAGGSVEDFTRFIASENTRWAKVIRSMDTAKKAGSIVH